MTSAFFDNVMRWRVERNGTSFLLPFFYYDTMSMAAIYTASTARIRALLPHPCLHPIELVPGRCLVAFAGFEYRKTDSEPYNEVNISFLVTYNRKSIPGLGALRVMISKRIPSYIWQLPVTTESARAGGKDLYGFPKSILDIQFRQESDWMVCEMLEAGERVLRMEGRVLATRAQDPIRYQSYAVEDNKVVIATSLVNPIEFAETRSRGSFTLETSDDHPIGQAIAEMKLGKAPIIYQFSPRNETMLFPARNVIED